MQNNQQSPQSSLTDPTVCILGSNTAINEVDLLQESNVTTNSTLLVTGVSSTKPVANTHYIQNEKQNAVLSTACMDVTSQLSQNTSHSQSETLNNPTKDIYKCPIKVVDMKKLLEKPPEEASNSESGKTHFKPPVKEQLGQFIKGKLIEGIFSYKVNIMILDKKDETPVKKDVQEKKFPKIRNAPSETSKITVFHILECLRVILPNKFDLARLVPNEKVASLIIRYYKLKDDEVRRNSVLTTLKLVINSSSMKENIFEDNLRIHPYSMISDKAIEAVLSEILPTNFSLVDASKEVLKCMCLLLKQEIFSDGYQILLHRLHKFSMKAKIFQNVPKKKVNNQSLLNKSKKIVYRTSTKPLPGDEVQNIGSESSLTSFERVNTSQYTCVKTKIEQDSNTYNSYLANDNTIEDPFQETDDNEDPFYGTDDDDQQDLDWTSETETKYSGVNQDVDYHRSGKYNDWIQPIKQKKPKKSKLLPNRAINLVNVLKYLELNKCLAKDVLGNFRLMFYLCRYLKIRTRKVNVKKIENLLKIIMERKIKISSELENDAKLKLKPIVIIHNLADYSKEKMLFMRSEETDHNSNGYCNNSFRNGLGQMKSVDKYTDDQVKILTEGCHKMFRKIIMKRNGATVVFRIKYSNLPLGSVVFVKDFQSSSRMWLRGTVSKRLGALRYSVLLDSGEIRHYVPDQLRPSVRGLHKQNALAVNVGTNLTSRRNRPIKLKQLLDL